MPGFGVPAGMPGIPSPATGVPATPDFLSGLLQAAPAAEQWFQQGEQIREMRRKRAQEDLQQLAPYAVADPHNPNTVKAVQKAFKSLGLDPRAAINQDGSINSEALMQYNPWFGMFQDVARNPNANPQLLKFLGDKLGMKMPDLGAYTPKELDDKVKQFYDQLKSFTSGKGDQTALLAIAQGLQGPLMQAGRSLDAQTIMQAALGAHMGALPTEQVHSAQSLAKLRNTQEKNLALQALKTEAQIGNIKQDTVLKAHRVGLVDAQTVKAFSDAQATQQRVAQGWQRLQIESQKVSSQNISTALRAVGDYNKGVASLHNELRGYEGQLTSLTNNEQGDSAQAHVLQGLITKTQNMLNQYKVVDPASITGKALQNAGLPSTMKVLPGQDSATGGKPLMGHTFTRKDLMDIARKHGKSLQQVIKDYEAQGATVKP